MKVNATFSEDVKGYLAIIWQWVWLLALLAIIGAVSGYLYSKRLTPIYQSSTLVLVNVAPAVSTSPDYSYAYVGSQLAQSYILVMTTRPVLDQVVAELKLPYGASSLIGKISVATVNNSELIKISVIDPDPQKAADIANKVVEVFTNKNISDQAARYSSSKQNLETQLNIVDNEITNTNTALSKLGIDITTQGASQNLSLTATPAPTRTPSEQAEVDRLLANLSQYRQTYSYLLQSYEQVRLAEVQSTSTLIQVEPAIPVEYPISPNIPNNTLFAGAVGLVIAIGLVFLFEILNDTLKGPVDVTDLLGLTVLGMIARHNTEDEMPISAMTPRSPVVEAFRTLRTNLQFASVDKPLKTIIVTSPSPEDGKSTVASNLGVVLAQNGMRVCVVDADMRRPAVHKQLSLQNRHGAGDLFTQSQVVLNSSLKQTKVTGLYALTAGTIPPNPAELLGSEKMLEILHQIGQQVDIIIIDTPPIMAVTDASILAPKVDGVLLVVKPGITKLAACEQAVEQLQRVGANILGVVLNDVDVRSSRYRYPYYRGYHYYYSHDYYGNGKTRSRKKNGRKSGQEIQQSEEKVAEDTTINVED